MNPWLFLLIPLWMWLNRVRGDNHIFGLRLPGLSDLWVAPPMALSAWWAGVALHPAMSFPWIAYIDKPIPDAILFMFCWLAWSTPAWATLYRLGFMPKPRLGTWYEELFTNICGGNLVGALALRFTICLIPMALLFGLWWLALGPILTGCYYLGWTIASWRTAHNPNIPLDGIPWAEPTAGAVWGVAIIMSGAIG